MRKAKYISLCFVLFFLLATIPSMIVAPSAGIFIPSLSEWKTPEDTQLVYNVTRLMYSASKDTTMPVNMSEGDPGTVSEGDFLFFEYGILPELLTTSDTANVSTKETGTNFTSGWEMNYTVPLAYDSDWVSGSLVYPLIPVWASGAADWSFTGNIFESNDGNFTYSDGATHFSLRYLNDSSSPTGFIEVNATWNKATGIMEYYLQNTTASGSENEPLFIEIDFLYSFPVMDENEYAFSEDLYVSYFAKIAQNNSLDYIDFGGEGDDFMIYEGDVIGYDFSFEGPYEDGVMYSAHASTSSGYSESDIGISLAYPGQEHLFNGPPAAWPLVPMPLVDVDDYYGNFTAAWEAVGYAVTNSVDVISIQGTTAKGDHVNSTWSKETGVMMYYYVELDAEGNNIVMELVADLVVNMSAMDYSWEVPEGLYTRYLVSAQNGTDDKLAIGGHEDEPYYLYEGDVLSVNFTSFSMGETMSYEFTMRSSSGLEAEGEFRPTPPGLEFTEIMGPPGIQFAMLLGDDTPIYGDSFAVWEDVGYNVTDTADEFGFEAEIDLDVPGANMTGVYVSILWDKVDGVLNYYYVDGYDGHGNYVLLELTRGVSFVMGDMTFSWNVSVGDEFEYHFEDISIYGDNRFEFGDGYIHEDETLTFTITALSSSLEAGASVNMSLAATYDIEPNIFYYLVEPGFEFAGFDYYGEGGDTGAYMPLLMPIMPIFDESWAFLEDLYREPDYTVTKADGEFTVLAELDDGEYVEVTWNMADGHLTWYNASITVEMEGGPTLMTIVLTEGPGTFVPPPPTTTTTTTEPTEPVFSPGFEAVMAFTAIVAALVIRRKKR
ncbi:MAG: PGF-CTERM sorting domain-containing protein [Candidatus Odinarchaeota archaeon]